MPARNGSSASRRALSRRRRAALDEVARLGGHDEIGAGVARPADEVADLPQIGLGVGAGGELDAGRRERPQGRRHAPIPSLASSLPARSSATMSSQPPICSPSMKICGTVRPPCGAPDHLVAAPRLLVDVDLGEGDALLLQQRAGARAIGAPHRRIDLDLGHRRPAPPPLLAHWATYGAVGGDRANEPFAAAAPCRQSLPAIRLHELRPAPIEVAQIVLARLRLGQVHDRAGQGRPSHS